MEPKKYDWTKQNRSLLTPDEQMEIMLEGAQELHWEVGDSTFEATNEATGWRLFIRRKEETELEFPNLKTTFTFELSILINQKVDVMDRKYTYIRTGDYNRKCDKLLEQLYRKAQQKAQTNLLGDAQVSTG